jgi:hypothetical protein
MPMFALWFRVPPGVDESTFRARLEAEIGRRARAPDVETSWRGDVLEILTMDFVALAYAGKVAVALGGVCVASNGTDARPFAPAPWTATPWVSLPWWRRLRIWIGPTRSRAG